MQEDRGQGLGHRSRPGKRPVAPVFGDLPRERVVLPSPSACPCCGGKLSKLGEDITETLEVIVEGDNIPFERLTASINELGGSLHSIDEVTVRSPDVSLG